VSATRTWRQKLSFGNIGATYVWILIIVIFAVAVPEHFLTGFTPRNIVNNYTISGLAALAVLIPMASGAFDASIGGNMSLSGVICAYLLLHTALPVGVVVLITLGAGLAIGLFNVLVVVVLGISSLIGTLATWLIADALSVAIADNMTLSGPRVQGSFAHWFSGANLSGFAIPFLYMAVIAAVLWLLLARTITGRYIYAVGFNANVARLAGIRVKAIQAGALLCSGLIGALAGIVLTAHVASATPAVGDSYLLPAFAAVFVGATQFKAKRFNVPGTIIAAFMLGTGEYGLLVAGAPQWTPDVFQGLALIAAIGLTHLYDPNRAGGRTSAKRSPDEAPAVGQDSELASAERHILTPVPE
jgi:ribose transport system permease protein